MMNVCDETVRSGDVEGTTGTHGDFADIGSLLGPTCDDGTHEIARLEAFGALGSFWLRAREPMLVHQAHLP